MGRTNPGTSAIPLTHRPQTLPHLHSPLQGVLEVLPCLSVPWGCLPAGLTLPAPIPPLCPWLLGWPGSCRLRAVWCKGPKEWFGDLSLQSLPAGERPIKSNAGSSSAIILTGTNPLFSQHGPSPAAPVAANLLIARQNWDCYLCSHSVFFLLLTVTVSL